MKELKLLLLEKGDSQKNLVDKINFNFSEVISFEGGPYGKLGPEGKSGNSGSEGPTGSYGPQGIRGNYWTVAINAPSSPLNGDYWMNPNINNEIRVYNSTTSNWDLYSLSITGLDIFRKFGPLQTSSGVSSKNGYFISLPSPSTNTFVLSDSYLSSGSSVANPQYSKMVISINSQISNKKILEFTKGAYHGTSFNQETPYFNWIPTTPLTLTGTYGLSLFSPQGLDFDLGGNFNIKSVSRSILMRSGNTNSINFNVSNQYTINSSNGDLYVEADPLGSSFLFLGSHNIQASLSTYVYTTTSLDIQNTGTTGSQAGLNVISSDPDTGNIYYKMDETYPSTRSGSTLFKATNSSTDILEISGKGDFKVNKIVYPVQTTYNSSFVSTTVLGITTRYRMFTPAIALNGQTSSSSFNVSVGMDFYLDVPFNPNSYNPLTDRNGICLWTPATGGSGLYGENGGWLNLLGESEYVNFRVHSSRSDTGFRALGINTSETKNTAPSGGSSDVLLSGEASTIEFTIIDLSKTAGGTGGNKRWFKVLYQAWGNELTTPVCGELYTDGATP